jgi:hypothetical protein
VPDKDKTKDKATFGELLDALIGVASHRMPEQHVRGVYFAQRLKVNTFRFSSMRSGRVPVNDHILAVIIDMFGIGDRVDFRIFYEPTVDAFLARLKEAGVGTYGANQRHGLCQLLFNASRDSPYSIRFSQIVGPPPARGPLGILERKPNQLQVLKIGSQVKIACSGPEGRNLIVLSANPEAEVSVLMPSLLAPATRYPGKLVTLPTSDDYSFIDVKNDPNRHRLYALWTDDQVAALLRQRLDLDKDADDLDDRTAGAMARLISAEPEARRAVAARDYVVER